MHRFVFAGAFFGGTTFFGSTAAATGTGTATVFARRTESARAATLSESARLTLSSLAIRRIKLSLIAGTMAGVLPAPVADGVRVRDPSRPTQPAANARRPQASMTVTRARCGVTLFHRQVDGGQRLARFQTTERRQMWI